MIAGRSVEKVMEKTIEEIPIYIDGSVGEGGGQIIRTSVSLAAITGRTVEISNIRAGRSKPGLQAQHLTSVLSAAALCSAQVYGAEIGSTYLRFVPGVPTSEHSFLFDVSAARVGGSAGATGLVVQTLLVPLAHLQNQGKTKDITAVEVVGNAREDAAFAEIRGGTHVPMAPTADYLEAVYLPALRRLGLEATLTNPKAGFFPRGGGAVELTLSRPGLDTPLDLTERGRLLKIRLIITTSELPAHVGERGRDALLKTLRGYGVPIEVELRDLPGGGAGAALVIVAECENGIGGWTGLGERGKPMERVAEGALHDFQKWFATSAAVDEHLSDQLVLPCALIDGEHKDGEGRERNGESRWTTPTVTEHLRTVLAIVKKFLPITYRIEERTDGSGLVSLKGVRV